MMAIVRNDQTRRYAYICGRMLSLRRKHLMLWQMSYALGSFWQAFADFFEAAILGGVHKSKDTNVLWNQGMLLEDVHIVYD